MKKEDIYEFLKKKNIWHEITEHEAVWDMEELDNLDLPYPGRDAKNLFVRDDKKRVYYLISVKDDKRVDLNEFRNKYGTRRLSFDSENDLGNLLTLFPGAVTHFGLLNDDNLVVKFYLDKDFFDKESIIGVHPNDNTATVWLKVDDLVDIIKEHGNEVFVVNM
jgi:Ala-tRNA(Pro) deacylase